MVSQLWRTNNAHGASIATLLDLFDDGFCELDLDASRGGLVAEDGYCDGPHGLIECCVKCVALAW